MTKFMFFGFLVVISGLMTISSAHKATQWPSLPRSIKDTLIEIRTDTIIDNYLKDSSFKAIFKRDTAMQRQVDRAQVALESQKIAFPEIQTGDLNGLAVCAGSPIAIPFSFSGSFAPDNQFVLQLVDPTGKAVPISEPSKGNALTGLLPAAIAAGSNYKIRVASTNPILSDSGQSLRILPIPVAKLELPDGGRAITVLPGQPATIRVALSGQGPWSFVLSDGTRVVNTLTTPYELTVTPTQPTVYKVVTVHGPCGSGTIAGEVIVNVNENPSPEITLKAPVGGYKICTGTPFQVAFSATGRFNVGNAFVAQLADSAGNWTTISGSGTNSPLTARLPYGISPAKTYVLRVIATLPSVLSQTVPLSVAAQASAVLRSDSIKIGEGKTAELTLHFAGTGPWFILLSDGTYENNIIKTPHTLKVTPANPTQYRITSAGGTCGVGDFSGQAFVNVDVPPSTINTANLSTRTICHGSEITVPFSTRGRFYANNKWIVQIADTSGRFTSMTTTYKDGILKALINPTYLKDTLSTIQLRVVSTSPSVIGSGTTINLIAPNAGQAEITGLGTIRPGQTSKVRVAFKNGLPPWSFTLSDGTQVNGTFLNPYVMTVAPVSTTEYTITSLTSSCGKGIPVGKALITVDRN